MSRTSIGTTRPASESEAGPALGTIFHESEAGPCAGATASAESDVVEGFASYKKKRSAGQLYCFATPAQLDCPSPLLSPTLVLQFRRSRLILYNTILLIEPYIATITISCHCGSLLPSNTKLLSC